MKTIYHYDRSYYYSHTSKLEDGVPRPRLSTLVALPDPISDGKLARWFGDRWELVGERINTPIAPGSVPAPERTLPEFEDIIARAVGESRWDEIYNNILADADQVAAPPVDEELAMLRRARRALEKATPFNRNSPLAEKFLNIIVKRGHATEEEVEDIYTKWFEGDLKLAGLYEESAEPKNQSSPHSVTETASGWDR